MSQAQVETVGQTGHKGHESPAPNLQEFHIWEPSKAHHYYAGALWFLGLQRISAKCFAGLKN